jgi:hypothetical protein
MTAPGPSRIDAEEGGIGKPMRRGRRPNILLLQSKETTRMSADFLQKQDQVRVAGSFRRGRL